MAAAFSLALQCLQAPELRCTFASQKLHKRDLPRGSLSPSSTPRRLASSCKASSPSPSGATPSNPSAPRRPSTRSFSRQKTRYLSEYKGHDMTTSNLVIPSDSPMFSCLERSLSLSNNDTKQFEIRLHCRNLCKPGCSLILEPDEWQHLVDANLKGHEERHLASSSLASLSSLASSLRLSRSLPRPSLALSSTTVRLRTFTQTVT